MRTDVIGLIADDLTGANDSALQFFSKGAVTKILLDYNRMCAKNYLVEVWATSTESRNISSIMAYKQTFEAFKNFKDYLNVEHFYKKIDSTFRGHIALETLAALDATEKDAAIIVPAFIEEGRNTIGGFHMLKGVPIERTEAACDPHAPVKESNLVQILKNQLSEEDGKGVALIDFTTVAKGAASIASSLNKLIKSGKRLIVIDAMSVVDIEQIALAAKKCSYDILPCGSAGLAKVLANEWIEKNENEEIERCYGAFPKLVLSGSATKLSALQIKKLQIAEKIRNTHFINLNTQDILDGVTDDIVNKILKKLVKTNTVVVYTENLMLELEDCTSPASEKLIDEGISREDIAHKITKYLADLAQKIKEQQEFILISIGGETSYKCCKALYCENLQVVDTVLPAIPLCLSSNGQLVVTKSGNLGDSNTLVEIIKFFEKNG